MRAVIWIRLVGLYTLRFSYCENNSIHKIENHRIASLHDIRAHIISFPFDCLVYITRIFPGIGMHYVRRYFNMYNFIGVTNSQGEIKLESLHFMKLLKRYYGKIYYKKKVELCVMTILHSLLKSNDV